MLRWSVLQKLMENHTNITSISQTLCDPALVFETLKQMEEKKNDETSDKEYEKCG